MRQREPAICLRKSDYSETSQVVHFLARGWGAVRLLAKGAKRAKSSSGGAIDLLAEGDLVFIPPRGDGLGTLVEFEETCPRPGLRRDAARLNAALYMVEMTGAMVAEADPHPEVFDLLHSGLSRLASPDAPRAAVLAYFQWRLLRRVGLLGDLDRCVSCGGGIAAGDRTPRDIYFSSARGGLLCGDCEAAETEKFRLDAASLAGLAGLAAAEAGTRVTLPDRQARAVSRMLDYHAAHQLGRPLKMARHAVG